MPQQPSNIFAGPLAELQPHEEEQRRKMNLLKRVSVLRDAMNIKRSEVLGDPDTEYMWVNIREERQLHFQGLGWEKVTLDDDVVKTPYRKDDGTHIRGDLILYKMPKELAQAHQEYNTLLGLERIEGHKSAFRTAAAKEGIPTFTPKIA